MIETKEQYEMLKAEAQNLGYIALEGTGVHIIETIEALREVARDVVWEKRGGITGHDTVWYICHLCAEASPDGPVHEEHCPMNALPDWLTDG